MPTIILLFILTISFIGHAIADCTSNSAGDQTCCSGNVCYTTPSAATLNAEAQAQAAQDAINNAPANKFNLSLWEQQIAQTSFMQNFNLMQYFAVVDKLLSFNNFQGLANMIAGMLGQGIMTQSDVDSFDTVLENQQINLDSYNSEVNVSY